MTLPFAPTKVRVSGPAKFDIYPQDGDLPIIIVDGVDAFTVQLDGVIYDPAKTAEQVWDDIISSLLAKQGLEVQVTTSDGDLDDTYVLASFEPSRDHKLARWNYSMRLVKGSVHVIL